MEEDSRIKQLEAIINAVRNTTLYIDFCDEDYGYNDICDRYIKEGDEGCIVCKMIHEYRDMYDKK